jgi:hypothetical protein
MSHFYGILQGTLGQATRCGTKSSSMDVVAAASEGAVSVTLSVDDQGRAHYYIRLIPWHGHGVSRFIAQGLVGK